MIIILMGVSGSGKTTVGQQLATDLGWTYSEGDDFHSLKNIAKMSSGIPLNDEDRSVWLTQIRQHIEKLIRKKQNAVITCSALKQSYRKQLQINPERIKFVYLKGSEALIRKRIETRTGHFMHSDLLASQFEALQEPEQVMIVDIIESPEQISTIIIQEFGLKPQEKSS